MFYLVQGHVLCETKEDEKAARERVNSETTTEKVMKKKKKKFTVPKLNSEKIISSEFKVEVAINYSSSLENSMLI